MSKQSSGDSAVRETGEADTKGGRSYRKSLKREQTQLHNRQLIEQAAWNVFAEKGFDATTIRDIIAASGVSPGTFYNYYGTKEEIFSIVLTRLLEQVRAGTNLAREGGGTMEERLGRSLRACLEIISRINGGREFCEKNQQHIRMRLHQVDATVGIMKDMRHDYDLPVPGETRYPFEELLVVRMILAFGLEASFIVSSDEAVQIDVVSSFVAKLVTHGLKAWGEAGSSS